ncbi:hypothetical protein C8R44DRAFT_949078 [Mycena epipterygia]|nr:hypothetical protein C8R44DRAFT_949078 [Mycena epipterygia]
MSSKGVALVTGAAQGIGRGVALRLADDGFDVVVNDLEGKSANLDTLVEEIQKKGRASAKCVANVSEEEQVKEMVELAVQKLGRLDVMVANAGIVGRLNMHLVEVSSEEWDRVMNVNARGVFLCYKFAGIQMIKQGGGGRIIGASSLAGKQGKYGNSWDLLCLQIRGARPHSSRRFGTWSSRHHRKRLRTRNH